ncbi:hypothetical protein [Photobacterium damselae]|uniref:hypothetical protein n=1 Tax=Photobacterium damselae TaxID=38293 RepID=UPI001EFE8830|nr:hypothetical protein [Photobacterium damselae]MCG9780730.1 hypothetical protein [Photobacterium damselae]
MKGMLISYYVFIGIIRILAELSFIQESTFYNQLFSSGYLFFGILLVVIITLSICIIGLIIGLIKKDKTLILINLIALIINLLLMLN